MEPAQAELWESRRVETANLALAGGEEHGDPLRLEPPGDEDERVRGRIVEPLRIVDEAEDRLILGGLGEQAQRRERHEEAVAHLRREAQRSAEGIGLRPRKALEMAEDGADDLVQGCEGELRLRLDPAPAQNAHPAGLVARILEESRLADARLAGDDQDPT